MGSWVWVCGHAHPFIPLEKAGEVSGTKQLFILYLLLGSFPYTFSGVLSLPFRQGGKIKAGGRDHNMKCASLVGIGARTVASY